MIQQNSGREELPEYPFPWRLLAGLAWSALSGKRRSFSRDAESIVADLHPQVQVIGSEHVPAHGPCLITCNHYSREGFGAWWIGLAVSAAVAARRSEGAEAEIHWIMTAAWTFAESGWRHRILTPLTRWAFQRVSEVYGFLTMPPMPPDPTEYQARALAVRRAVRLAKRAAQEGGMIGLAPEGRDWADRIGQPPPGGGAFIVLLTSPGLPVLPVSVAEHQGKLRVAFGHLFRPQVPAHRGLRDTSVSKQVMEAIARQMPEE